jgi:NAD(P)-dependent dehydrogenase (short-subunit alcohol dehydrogenase family)
MCAAKPTPTMALYCATSAAREMFHAVLAMDHRPAEKDATTISDDDDDKPSSLSATRILSYAPGSCDTAMQQLLRDHDSLDPAVQAYCRGLVSDGGLVRCDDTAQELVRRVLEPGAFQSGERVEYVNMSTYIY